MRSSAISKFYRLSVEDRIKKVANFADLNQEEIDILRNNGSLPTEVSDHMVENFLSNIEIPMGIATNFMINGKDYLIPMAIEEPSVIAACSNAAKIARASGGFTSFSTDPLMIGQIQLLDIPSPEIATVKIQLHKQELLSMANEKSKTLSSMNAGAKDLYTTYYESPKEMLIVNLIVDVRDAMGANIVNSMCEHISSKVEELTGGRANLRILTNLSDLRISYSFARFKSDLIGGEDVSRRIVEAYEFAAQDIHRAATHNKGVMNGVDAVLLATLNDWRAVEAGAHAYHSIAGYKPFTRFRLDKNGDLLGSIKLPIAVGTVGGATRSVPKAQITRKILGVKSSSEFANIIAAVGLAQNFAALRALADEGIQKGHMKLHSRNLAISAGATGRIIDVISERMIQEGNISLTRAREILNSIRNERNE